MSSQGLSFHHPVAFWLGCLAIVGGALSHMPMFLHAAPMGYHHMAGMPMSMTMMDGIDTRGLRLEDINAVIQAKALRRKTAADQVQDA